MGVGRCKPMLSTARISAGLRPSSEKFKRGVQVGQVGRMVLACEVSSLALGVDRNVQPWAAAHVIALGMSPHLHRRRFGKYLSFEAKRHTLR